jgi:hypothetical protein
VLPPLLLLFRRSILNQVLQENTEAVALEGDARVVRGRFEPFLNVLRQVQRDRNPRDLILGHWQLTLDDAEQLRQTDGKRLPYVAFQKA